VLSMTAKLLDLAGQYVDRFTWFIARRRPPVTARSADRRVTRDRAACRKRAPQPLTPAESPARGVVLGLLAVIPLWVLIALVLKTIIRNS